MSCLGTPTDPPEMSDGQYIAWLENERTTLAAEVERLQGRLTRLVDLAARFDGTTLTEAIISELRRCKEDMKAAAAAKRK